MLARAAPLSLGEREEARRHFIVQALSVWVESLGVLPCCWIMVNCCHTDSNHSPCWDLHTIDLCVAKRLPLHESCRRESTKPFLHTGLRVGDLLIVDRLWE